MAILILCNGKEKMINPARRRAGFTIREMYHHIGSKDIHVIFLADGRRMVADAGDLEEINEKATALYHEGRNTGKAIRGTVVVGNRQEIQ
jgi:hypothetical protein